MKLSYEPIRYDYRVIGTKAVSEGYHSVKSSEELLIESRLPMPFVRYQILKFTRKVNTNADDSAFDNFAKDSANALCYFELEFTPKGGISYVANHENLKKKWISDLNILRSKYAGGWADRALEEMTDVINNEQKLRAAIAQDFCLDELYNRKIYVIAFDSKTRTASQTCTETAIDSIPFVFVQQCIFKQYLREQVVVIDGIAPLNENKEAIMQLCKGKTFKSEDVVIITQHTEYRAFELLNIPEKIETVFKVNDKNGCLKEVNINIQTRKY